MTHPVIPPKGIPAKRFALHLACQSSNFSVHSRQGKTKLIGNSGQAKPKAVLLPLLFSALIAIRKVNGTRSSSSLTLANGPTARQSL
jgi:hypothetical protein